MSQPRVLENKYKIGQRVAVRDLDTPQRYFEAWIIGVKREQFSDTLVYEVAERWDNINGYKWFISDIPEDQIEPEHYINS